MSDQDINLQMTGTQQLSLTQGIDTGPSQSTGDGITVEEADLRYLKKPTGGNIGDVLTKTGTDTTAWTAPGIPLTSTNW